ASFWTGSGSPCLALWPALLGVEFPQQVFYPARRLLDAGWLPVIGGQGGDAEVAPPEVACLLHQRAVVGGVVPELPPTVAVHQQSHLEPLALLPHEFAPRFGVEFPRFGVEFCRNREQRLTVGRLLQPVDVFDDFALRGAQGVELGGCVL